MLTFIQNNKIFCRKKSIAEGIFISPILQIQTILTYLSTWTIIKWFIKNNGYSVVWLCLCIISMQKRFHK